MEKMILIGRLAAFACFVTLLSLTTCTAFPHQKAINSIAITRYRHSPSNNSIITAESERNLIGKFLIDSNSLNRNLPSSTTKSEGNMSIAVYEEIKDLPNHPEKTLIDVREPHELKQTGVIPTSINIPLAEVTNALNLSDEQFKVKYERTKPSNTSEIIFSCRSGVRAGRAVVATAALGFVNIKNYQGSWLDWAQREGLPV